MTMRYARELRIGSPGAIYEFRIKLSMRVRGVKISDAELQEETQLAIEEFAEHLRRDYPWIGDVYQTGRSGGWLAIVDGTGGATKAKLEKIDEMVDQARRDFETAIIESYGYTENGSGSGSLQEDLERLGVQIAHHESDLQVPDTPEVRRVLAQHGKRVDGHNVVAFRNQVEGGMWLEIPFAYTENGKQQKLRGAAFVDPKLKKAYDFFREHGGGIVGESGKSALNLARAEAYAEDHDWEFEWEDDPEPYERGEDEDEPSEVLNCLLRDDSGKVLASLGAISFGHDSRANRDYKRVVEAELALEAMPESELVKNGRRAEPEEEVPEWRQRYIERRLEGKTGRERKVERFRLDLEHLLTGPTSGSNAAHLVNTLFVREAGPDAVAAELRAMLRRYQGR